MHRTSLRTGGGSGGGGTMPGGGVAVLRPPKPPCWRDFVAPDPVPRKDHFPALSSSPFPQTDWRTVADLTGGGLGGGDALDVLSVVGGGRLLGQLNSPAAKDYNISTPAAGGGSKLSSRASGSKRSRARIHRTRSEYLVDVEELVPEEELTVHLADTTPNDLKLRARPAADDDDRLYVAENNRRCQSWLAGIEAAEPLEDIGYNHTKNHDGIADTDTKNHYDTKDYEDIHSKDHDDLEDTLAKNHGEEVGLESVDVEVPEETFSWRGEGREGEGEGEEGEGGGEGEGEERGEREKSEAEGEREGRKGPRDTNVSTSHSGRFLLTTVGCCPSTSSDSSDEKGACTQALTGREGRVVGTRGVRRGGLRVTSSSLSVHRQLSFKHILTISEQSGLE